MDLNKIPRWALVGFATLGMLAMGFVANNVYADSQKTKVVAYTAKNSAETAQMQVSELRGAVQDIQNKSETFRREYREDRNLDAQKLQSMEDRIIKAVKG